ncbi:S8 family serine peptidase [Solirubrobacter ginsenosidimutans]|uniref:S8 family serine peptidase n=1 Tax=Solirubrobacter ginsenosidimutans TaxID=490573 RepID=A0A9X3S421_9ACTN|nr:S8 family serine peptidase [Solirubrobacter ginsenosidimutans]MDA0165209.1 S8 family serine peptidase [Solirubrobacter ginsenosidimutans]
MGTSPTRGEIGRRAVPLILAAALLPAGSARAQTPQVRLAAPSSCPVNVNCIPGFKRVYKIDPSGASFVRLRVADAGVQALDDGVAEVAAVFTSNPQLSRPDILPLRDDKRMISRDHVVPVVRSTVLRTYGPALRRAFDGASRLLTTLQLRGLNQQVIDGRLPEAVGGEFVDANGLGGPARRTRSGRQIVIGFQAFDENETLAYLYAAALRGAGFRVKVRAIGGLRPETVAAFRRKRIDVWPGYSGSLLGYLGGTSLRGALAKLGATPMRLSPAEDRNAFAMKRDVAARLGISRLSDLARYWPKASKPAATAHAAQAEELQDEQWAVAPDSVINLPGAWQLSQGAGVTVAVIDSGARLDHPDLAPNIWTNFDEVPGNGIDDDHNGYIDDVHGVDLSTTQPGQDVSDGYGHGTHVAGIIAAALNGRGVVGAAPQAKLMIIKIFDNSGAGTTGSVAEGIRYAAANGARVINLSLTSDSNDERVAEAVQAAAAANVLVVAAAGNAGRDIDTAPAYPAALPASNLLAVASTDPSDGRSMSDYSNFGRLTVQVAAPGAQILSTANDGSYVDMSGTSMASPMVAGVAALVAGANPQISAVDLRAALMQNADPSQLPVAAGYVDALRTVLAATGGVSNELTRPPKLKILTATRKGRTTKIRTAVSGSTAAVNRYRVSVNSRAVAQLEPGRSPFTVKLRRGGTRATVDALDAAGKVIASASRRIVKLRKGKRDVGTGGGVHT